MSDPRISTVGLLRPAACDRVLRLGLAHAGGEHRPRRPALEVDAEVEPAGAERDQSGHDDDPREQEPQPAATDEVEPRVAPVHAHEGARVAAAPAAGPLRPARGRRLPGVVEGLLGLQLLVVVLLVALVVGRAVAPVRRRVGRLALLVGRDLEIGQIGVEALGGAHWSTAPATARPRDTPKRPSVRRSLRPSSTTSGRVKKYVMKTSRSVESPRKKANPFTSPMARMNSTAAAANDTRSAASTVRQALWKPRSTLVRTVRPERVSSFNRSKYTM